jgi:glutathione peroxidase
MSITENMSTTLLDIPLRRIDNTEGSLADYKGSVLLIVNVASKCGLTPQYAGLEKAYETQRERGLVVLGFPSNDFAAQEPGTESEIQTFCQTTFGVKFPMFSKIAVNGEARHPLYSALIAAQPKATAVPDSKLREKLGSRGLLPKGESDVMWNFEKFLVSRDGKVIGRFAPDITVEDQPLAGAIEKALG